MSGTPVLEAADLRVRFPGRHSTVHAVNGVSFTVREGESLAIVGESGSGKSVTALAIMGLLPSHCTVSGQIRFHGQDLLRLRDRDLRRIRGREIAMIYQDPMTSLNPTLTIGRQLTQVIRHHLGAGRREAADRAAELLDLVGIPVPRRRLGDYPHQFSGGQRQRILIAQALACDPTLLIADEPTTALDVTIQAQIIDLVQRLRERLGTTVLWITHDLGVVAGMVDRVMVMYGGLVTELAPVQQLFDQPRHPYTQGLLASLPTGDSTPGRLTPIPGTAPTFTHEVLACPFGPRCSRVEDRCREHLPVLETVDHQHQVACFRAEPMAR